MQSTSKELQFQYRRLFKDFLNNSYINGLRLLLLSSPVKYAKALWLTLLAVIVVWTHIVIVNLTLEYIIQPTEIRMSPNLVHVANSPFPAVAVCSANKVSKRLLHEYAAEIYQHQSFLLLSANASQLRQAIRSVDDMAGRLLVLVDFYLHPHDEPQLVEDELNHLHWLLSTYGNNSDYSVRDILRKLSPDCSELVVRGIVYGEPVNTSRLFIKRPTSSNVCCIFNYRRPSYSLVALQRQRDDAELQALPRVVFESNSILNSVQFVLRDVDESDYVYTGLSNQAFQLYIFPQEDYATTQSTTLGEVLVDHNTIVEIPIQPKFLDSSYAVRKVAPEKRRCYYPDEGQKLLNQSYYSLNECLLVCRIQSMLEHCGCVSPPMAGSAIYLRFCRLPDLPCLLKWKRIWYGYDTFPYVNYVNEDKGASFKQCGACLPTCNGVDFDIVTNVAPLRTTHNTNGYTRGLLKGYTNERPLAIIKLFFKLRHAQVTQIYMVGDWVVLLNRFGGILSLMYGFSIISYIELIYYLTGKWFVCVYQAFRRPQTKTKNKLYWTELLPYVASLRRQ